MRYNGCACVVLLRGLLLAVGCGRFCRCWTACWRVCSSHLRLRARACRPFPPRDAWQVGEDLAPLFMKLLLAGIDKRVYNCQDKTIGNVLGQLLGTDVDSLQRDIASEGDVSLVCEREFKTSSEFEPQKESSLSLDAVDALLTSLTTATREQEQTSVWSRVLVRTDGNPGSVPLPWPVVADGCVRQCCLVLFKPCFRV